MAAEPLGGGDQPVDFGRGQVLPAAPRGIRLLRRRGHRTTFPKTMVGATFAKGLFASLRLTSGQLTCPKRRTIWKVCRLFHPPFSSLPPPMRALWYLVKPLKTKDVQNFRGLLCQERVH